MAKEIIVLTDTFGEGWTKQNAMNTEVYGDITALDNSVTALEDGYVIYEIFENIGSGTSGTTTKPTDSTILLDRYEEAGDAIVTKTDTNGRPLDEPAREADTTIITATFDAGGNYVLSGIPSAYPVSIIYQISITRVNSGNVTIDQIVDKFETLTLAGPVNAVQTNDSGVLGGSAGLTYNGALLDVIGNIQTSGNILFNGAGLGLSYGQIYEEGGVTQLTLPLQDTLYQIISFSTNGLSNGMVPDFTENHITVSSTGTYIALFNLGFSQTVKVSVEYDFHIMKNNGAVEFLNISGHADASDINVVVPTAAFGIIALTAGDTVELWGERLTAGAVSKTINIPQVSVVLIKIGG